MHLLFCASYTIISTSSTQCKIRASSTKVNYPKIIAPNHHADSERVLQHHYFSSPPFHSNAPSVASNVTPKAISLECSGDYTVGHLYLPEKHDGTQRYPAVVAGSMASVKGMTGTYARELSRRGASDGVFRQREDPASKAAALSAVVEFLVQRSDVGSTGLLGICTSGGNVLDPESTDTRVKTVTTVAGFFQTGFIAPFLHGSSLGLSLYYENLWVPVARASRVKAPPLIVHSKQTASPDQEREVYEKLGGQEQIVWVDRMHYDFYDNAETVRSTADELANHFHAYLS